MKAKALAQINSHWSDGRHLSAGEGAEMYAPDDDKDAVAHLEYLVSTRQAEAVKEEPEPKKPAASAKKTAASE